MLTADGMVLHPKHTENAKLDGPGGGAASGFRVIRHPPPSPTTTRIRISPSDTDATPMLGPSPDALVQFGRDEAEAGLKRPEGPSTCQGEEMVGFRLFISSFASFSSTSRCLRIATTERFDGNNFTTRSRTTKTT